MIKRDLIVGVIFLIAGGAGGFVYANEKKITVCHATGSSSNPYVMISVSASALDGLSHAGDFIPAPGATNCTQMPSIGGVGGVN